MQCWRVYHSCTNPARQTSGKLLTCSGHGLPAVNKIVRLRAASRFGISTVYYLCTTMTAPVKVQIFGQTYTIRGELDERYVQKLAAYVDAKMSAIADATTTIDTQKVAVLAALAIADELHTIRKDRTEEEELLREQAERCLTLVERALKQTA
jgi:cell division protein ZapA